MGQYIKYQYDYNNKGQINRQGKLLCFYMNCTYLPGVLLWQKIGHYVNWDLFNLPQVNRSNTSINTGDELCSVEINELLVSNYSNYTVFFQFVLKFI